jgi:hypothetical protein
MAGRRRLPGLCPFHRLDQRGGVALEAEFLDKARDHATRVLTVEDREGDRSVEPGGMLTKEPGAEPVERAGP